MRGKSCDRIYQLKISNFKKLNLNHLISKGSCLKLFFLTPRLMEIQVDFPAIPKIVVHYIMLPKYRIVT